MGNIHYLNGDKALSPGQSLCKRRDPDVLSAPLERGSFQDDELLSPQKLQVRGGQSKDNILDYLCYPWGVSSARLHLPKSP